MVNGWKTTAIIFICLFIGLLALNIWAVAEVMNEEAEVNDCYYNVCEEYPDKVGQKIGGQHFIFKVEQFEFCHAE